MKHRVLSAVLLLCFLLPDTLDASRNDTVKNLPGLPEVLATKLSMSAGLMQPVGL